MLYCMLTMDGLRAGEALGLQWGDIDFEHRLLHIRRFAWYGKIQTAKTTASETVLPIPELLVSIFKAYRTQWKPNADGFLFSTRNGRPPSSNKVVEYHLWTVLDALGIPRCGLHAFRHSHTSLLLDSGATPKVVQRQLRQADARTTLQIYGHIVGDAHREAVERVASIVDGNGHELHGKTEYCQLGIVFWRTGSNWFVHELAPTTTDLAHPGPFGSTVAHGLYNFLLQGGTVWC
jgi:integrase